MIKSLTRCRISSTLCVVGSFLVIPLRSAVAARFDHMDEFSAAGMSDLSLNSDFEKYLSGAGWNIDGKTDADVVQVDSPGGHSVIEEMVLNNSNSIPAQTEDVGWFDWLFGLKASFEAEGFDDGQYDDLTELVRAKRLALASKNNHTSDNGTIAVYQNHHAERPANEVPAWNGKNIAVGILGFYVIVLGGLLVYLGFMTQKRMNLHEEGSDLDDAN